MLTKTTLEQWTLLQAVVELGGFAPAAQAFNRSQSSISYQLSLMQERLGVTLLEPSGRRTVLTAQGQQLLTQVIPLLHAFQALEWRADVLRRGGRARIDLVVDSIFPKPTLFSALRTFQLRYPHTQVHLMEVLRSESRAQLAGYQADIWLISQPWEGVNRGRLLMEMAFVAVARSDHPLHQLAAPLSFADLGAYPLIEIIDRQQQKDSLHKPANAENWTFTTVEAALEAVMHGVGYGWMPETLIVSGLASGELKLLPLPQGGRRFTPLYLVVEEEKQPCDTEVATLVSLLTEATATLNSE
ncbi:LysR family transcriptional regulator [Dickeya poaceiphila]|uniref:LysR family transcriptional regulator n=1 Tax=Dickeya poaceiphila TaxID=568768 RepID=A0A5B8ID03_9GAMM|nr:LysR family transcriptional regulator [Dickeya poaceiphila]QDX31984.1 LysR family transcriptional regulator [Dickeya poaceiphila]